MASSAGRPHTVSLSTGRTAPALAYLPLDVIGEKTGPRSGGVPAVLTVPTMTGRGCSKVA
jgi:hypothetical protein